MCNVISYVSDSVHIRLHKSLAIYRIRLQITGLDWTHSKNDK